MTLKRLTEPLRLIGNLVLDLTSWPLKCYKKTKAEVLGLSCFCSCHNLTEPDTAASTWDEQKSIACTRSSSGHPPASAVTASPPFPGQLIVPAAAGPGWSCVCWIPCESGRRPLMRSERREVEVGGGLCSIINVWRVEWRSFTPLVSCDPLQESSSSSRCFFIKLFTFLHL